MGFCTTIFLLKIFCDVNIIVKGTSYDFIFPFNRNYTDILSTSSKISEKRRDKKKWTCIKF